MSECIGFAFLFQTRTNNNDNGNRDDDGVDSNLFNEPRIKRAIKWGSPPRIPTNASKLMTHNQNIYAIQYLSEMR